jgi:hypothetical protein
VDRFEVDSAGLAGSLEYPEKAILINYTALQLYFKFFPDIQAGIVQAGS